MDSFLKIMYSSTNLKEIYGKKSFALNTLGETDICDSLSIPNLFTQELPTLLVKSCKRPAAQQISANSTTKVLGHFALLPACGLSVHLPLPTPNTMLMLIHPKKTYYCNIVFWGGGENSEN